MKPYVLDQDEYMFHYCLVECAHEELDLKLSCEQSYSNSDTSKSLFILLDRFLVWFVVISLRTWQLETAPLLRKYLLIYLYLKYWNFIILFQEIVLVKNWKACQKLVYNMLSKFKC